MLKINSSHYIGEPESTRYEKSPLPDFNDQQNLEDYYKPDNRNLEEDFAEYQTLKRDAEKHSSSSYSEDDADDRSVSSTSSLPISKQTKEAVSQGENSMSVFDYRLFLGLGFALAFLSFMYLYWMSFAKEIEECDETNMTMQYAIDKTTQLQSSHVIPQVFLPNISDNPSI
jgi:CCR4-NOT transcriptional regulation complex NOT5 subunit